jgi:hypothetical protein
MNGGIMPIRFRGVSVGRFPRETWRSIHVWVYEITEKDTPDAQFLQALVGGEVFAYSYIAPYPNPEIDGDRVHGPYIISRLSVADFRPTTLIKVTQSIDHFLQSGQSPCSLEELSLSSALPMPLSDSAIPYELRGPETAFHRAGRLLGEYSDFVMIDKERMTLKEIVLGHD